jgi:hypothetical protein
MNWTLCLYVPILLTGCRDAESPAWAPEAGPTGPGSEAPAFHVGPQGAVYLSWIEWVDDSTSTLRFSARKENAWTPPREIARGTDWFVNWADRPGLTAFSDGQHLAAHWLQKSANGKYNYDVLIALSPDGGETWGEPFVLHDDGIAAEHGFVSTARDGDKLFFCWLDGRNTRKDDAPHDGHGHDHTGAMTLRGAWLDRDGRKTGDVQLDSMICDCCPTAVTPFNNGLVVTYRDRSPQEVRDIAQVRWDGQSWSDPVIPHADDWLIAGCPVNGPAMAHRGDTICRVWYGVRDSVAHVSAALSHDGGDSWQAPVLLDGNEPVGRVDVMDTDAGFFVTWIGRCTKDTTCLLGLNLMVNGRTQPIERIAALSASRISGYPVVIYADGTYLSAYPSETDGVTRISMAKQVHR